MKRTAPIYRDVFCGGLTTVFKGNDLNILVYIFGGLFFVSFLTSAGFTAGVIRWACKTNFVCHPQADRYSKRTVALGGGIAIFINLAGFLIASIVGIKFLAVQSYFEVPANIQEYIVGFESRINQLFVLLGSLLLLHIVGLIDDKKHLGPMLKLFAQFVTAFVAAFFGDIRVEMFIDNVFITSCLSAFWIVLIVNSFNFLDNMDGLSAGIAAICSAILLAAAAKSGQVFVSGLAIVFIGTLVGFLAFNFPPAKVFMGDAGSLVVGFVVACLTLKTTYYHQAGDGAVYSVFLPLIVMAVPLYDFISVFILRISQGRSPFVGDTQHFSHRIRRRGLTDKQTAATMYIATLACGISGLFLYKVSLGEAILVFAHTILILVLVAILESAGGGFEEQR